MAERLYYEFQNDKNIFYRVSIHDADFSGTTSEITPGEDGFILEYTGKEEELYVPICASTCTFPIIVTSDNDTEVTDFIDDLATGTEDRFTVAIYKDPDGDNDLFWTGVVLADQTEFEDNTPYSFDLVASDDIGNLKGVDYTDDGTPYTGQQTMIEHALNCLNKTRTTGFWGADDVFAQTVNWFNHTQGTVGVDAVAINIYDEIGFVHEEMYDTNQNGVIEYPSAYDILEAICQTYMATLIQADGVWWFHSRQVHSVPGGKGFKQFKKDATFIADSSDFDFIPINNTTGARRLAGYGYAFLNPANRVEIEYDFKGNIAVINDSWDETNYGTLTATSDSYIVPSGEKLVLIVPLNIQQEADGTRTGDDRVLRYQIRVNVKCGDYYLKRDNSIAGSGIYTLDDGTQVDLFGFQLQGASWTSTDTDSLKWFTPAINAHDGDSLVYNFFFETPTLPDDSLGIEVTVDVVAYDASGTTSAGITSAAFADAVVVSSPVRCWIGDGGSSSGNTILFYSETDNNAREVVELGSAVFGDNVSNAATRGSLRYDDGSYTIGQWAASTTIVYGLVHQTLTKQHLAQRKQTTKIMRGTLYYDYISMAASLFYQVKSWSIFSMRYNANFSEWDIEAFHVLNSTSDITVAEGDRFDSDSSGGSTDDGLGLTNGLTADTGNQLAENNAVQIAAIRPAGEAGVAVRSSSGDTYGTTLRGRSGLASDEVLTLPSGFWMSVQGASPLSASGTTYFMPLATGYSLANTSLDIQGRFMAAFDVEVIDCVILCENAAGSTTVNLIVNGSTVDTLTPTLLAGTPLVLDFSGNDVDQGDTVSISINGTNAPGDTYITLGFRIK